MSHEAYTIVTGGAGFIGSAVVRELNHRGVERIVIADNLGFSDKWQNLVGKKFSECLHKDSLFDWLEKHQKKVGTIIHLGACSNTLERDANYLLENNYRYSRRLAEFAIPRDIRFVYASSAATYGNGSLGFTDDHSCVETFQPLNMYGYSKHMFDLWLLRQNLLDKVVGLKYFNVYGPNEWHKGRMASAIVKMVAEVSKSGTIQLFKSAHPSYEDGGQKRDFIYVKDVAELTCDLAEASAHGIFNIGTGEAATWNRLGEAVFSAVGKPVKIEYISMPEDLVGKYQYFTQAETKKVEQTLNRKTCRYTLEQAVSDYVNNHLLPEKRW
jgi:ADP-L-glycero-D-manno-heptose 6-epimerase